MASNTDKIPLEIRQLHRWVCWRQDTRGDKPTKVPIQAEQPTKLASSTNSATWAPFEMASLAVKLKQANGLGFVLGAGYCGIDIDKCRDPISNQMSEDAQTIIDHMASYTEASPSGTGVHILIKAKLPDGWRKLGNVEIYSDGRYFTVTGQRLGIKDEIEERTEALLQLHTRLEGILFNEKRIPKAKANPEDFWIEAYPRSKGDGPDYITKVHKETGKASCNCFGWKYRLRNGKPCWHSIDLRSKHGFTEEM